MCKHSHKIVHCLQVALVGGSANDPTIKYDDLASVQRWGQGKVAQVAGDGIPHQQVLLFRAVDKDTAVVAVQDLAAPGDLQGEVRGRDLIRWIQHRSELHAPR
jgi:hypothetical protein